jgi:hypothetical protein
MQPVRFDRCRLAYLRRRCVLAKIASMVGIFGAIMALFGSVVAMMTGGVGVISGVESASVSALNGFWGTMMAVAGFVGAIVVRSRVWRGVSIMGVSALVGLAIVTWYYLMGALLFFIAVLMVLRADQEDLYGDG